MISEHPLSLGPEQRAYLGVRRWRDRLIGPVVGGLSLLRVPAWAVSVLGVVAAVTTILTAGPAPRFALAGYSVALLADMVDGAVARRLGTASARGKWLDHGCDTCTFVALVIASVASGYVSGRLAALALVATSMLLVTALAVARHRDPQGFRQHPRAGFFAHLPKLAFYVAFPVALAGGPDGVSPALVATAGLAIAFTPWVALGWRR